MKNIGLSTIQVSKLQDHHGTNELKRKKKNSVFALLLNQLSSPLIYILLAAAVITFFLRDYTDMVVILLAVGINTALGFFQENKAQKTLESLNKLLAPKTKVIRNGKKQIILAAKLVPGDVVVLEIGARVPADGIVIKADSLFLNEAILTGESKAADKKVFQGMDFSKAKDENQVFMGTIVAGGIGLMRVMKIGHQTKMGKIATSLHETKEPKTPLQKKLDEIARLLAIFVGLTGVLVFIIGIILGHSFIEMFTTSVALAVASIPEGLAVSLTVILAVGMQRILKQKAVVRKLVAAETLGSVTIICTDKTGTLTYGKMQVVGSKFVDDNWGLKSTVLCNDERDPLEIGMLEWAQKQAEYDNSWRQYYSRIDEIPFDPNHKYIATLYQDKKTNILLVSGAPEILLKKSAATTQEKKEWLNVFDKAAEKGLRIVAFAKKSSFSKPKIQKEDITNLEFLGVLYFDDPVRESVKPALVECRQAGIKVKVITGDYKKTALAVLQKLGLVSGESDSIVVQGEELEKMPKAKREEWIKKAVLFSRVTPWQKLEIVEVLQKNNEVIAMTGDGVNDAPAIKKADIGIVVENASDVSKQTADMVLLDSNFNTIVHAVEEGRGMFDNIRKIILYLLCDAFGEVLLVIGSLVARVPLAITASQILWINLVSDGFPNLALTVEPKESDLMQRKPRSLREPVVDLEIKFLIVLISTLSGVLTFGLYLYYLYVLKEPLELSRTVAFTSLGINSLLYVFSCRNLKKPIWRENQFKNPWLLAAVIAGVLLQLVAVYARPIQVFLNTVSLGWRHWEHILMINLIVIIFIELTKWVFSQKKW